jgi:hypothetical protein
MNIFVANDMSSEGDESEVFVCEKHGKRFLLGLYVRDPTEKEPCPKELRKTAAGLKVLEESCAGTENDDLRVTVTAPVASGGEGGDDATILGSMEHSSKCHGVRRSQEQSPPLQSDSGTWTWL